LGSRFPVSLRYAINSHGWINLEPWEWDQNGNILSRVESLPDGRRIHVRVAQQTPLRFLISLEGALQEELIENRIRHVVSRWLSLEWGLWDNLHCNWLLKLDVKS